MKTFSEVVEEAKAKEINVRLMMDSLNTRCYFIYKDMTIGRIVSEKNLGQNSLDEILHDLFTHYREGEVEFKMDVQWRAFKDDLQTAEIMRLVVD